MVAPGVAGFAGKEVQVGPEGEEEGHSNNSSRGVHFEWLALAVDKAIAMA